MRPCAQSLTAARSHVARSGQQRTMAEGASRDLLAGHMHYRKLQDLNEGTFGVVMLAQDVRTNEEVRYCDF